MRVRAGYKQTEVGVIPEEWEVKRLGEIFQFLNTANNARSDLSEYGDIAYIHYGDIHTNSATFLDCSKTSLPLIDVSKVKNVPLLEDGDLIMVDASEDSEGIGKCIEVQNIKGRRVVAGLHTFLLRGSCSDLAHGFKGYLQFIPLIKRNIIKAATGISVYGISKNNIKKLKFALPPLEEQRAIAAALSDVDALLAALDALIAKKRAIKQATMQQLLTGTLRLPGFHGEWEVKRLGEIAEIVSGGTPSTSETSYWNGSIKWCTPTDITRTSNKYLIDTEKYISEAGLRNSSANLLPIGSLLVCTRATIGEIKIAADIVCTNQGFKSLICTEFVDNQFLYYVILTIKPKLIEKAIGSTFLEISKKDISSIEINLPPLEEQTAIAAVLTDMDDEIAALERRRAKTQAVKQGMMQELLTGQVRLV